MSTVSLSVIAATYPAPCAPSCSASGALTSIDPVTITTGPLGEPTPLERQQLKVTAPDAETFWHRVRFELVGQIADRTRASRVLDIGAGSGLLGAWLQSHQPVLEYRYEETSPSLDAALEERFGASRRSEPEAAISSSTLVAMLDVLEHIDDDAAALRVIARRMRPGAHLVATVPALQWAFSSWDSELGHFRRYSRRTLRELVSEAGLRVEQCDYLFPELLPLLPVRKLRRAKRADADFPQLDPRVAAVGYRISRATASARRLWPAGTSVLVVARRDDRG
jgi:SAM-dependent methyltransferase